MLSFGMERAGGLHYLLEVIRAGHEVGLSIDFDQHAYAAAGVNVALDEALAGLAVGALGRGGDALFAQVSDGLLDVAVAVFELDWIETSGGANGLHLIRKY